MSSPAPAPAVVVATLRMIVGSVMIVPVVLLVVLVVIKPTGNLTQYGGWLWPGIAIVVGVVIALAIPTLGYQVPALSPSVDQAQAAAQGRAAFQTTAFLRLALSEAVVLVGFALAFVVSQGGLLVYLPALVIGEGLLFLHAWPGDTSINRVQDKLNREGAHVDLRSALGI